MSPALTLKAFLFAEQAHAGQVRKYTNEPYLTHCLEVASIIRDTPGVTTEMLAAALLHDVIEDCHVTREQLEDEFGFEVASLVFYLTDPDVAGNRAHRKEQARLKLGRATAQAQTIKLADLISNTRSIVEHDPKFAKVYLAEKRLLLEVLTKGDPELHAEATRIANQ